MDKAQEQQYQIDIIEEITELEAIFVNDFSILPLGKDFFRIVFMERSLPELPRRSRVSVLAPTDLVEGMMGAIQRMMEMKAKAEAGLAQDTETEGSA